MVSPRFSTGTNEGAPTPVPPFRCALRCLRFAIPPSRRSFAPCRPATPGRGLRGVGVPVPEPEDSVGEGRGSQVPGDPSCALALFSDPGGIGHARPSRRADAVPAADKSEDSRNDLFAEAQSHGLDTRCLRFAGRVAPPPRKTRFRLLASSAGRDSLTRRVPMKGFRVRGSSPFPKLLGAMSVQFRPWGVVRKRSGRRGPSNEAMQRTRCAGR